MKIFDTEIKDLKHSIIEILPKDIFYPDILLTPSSQFQDTIYIALIRIFFFLKHYFIVLQTLCI